MLSFLDAKRVVDSALAAGRLAILVGRCRVFYEGRAASKLSEGDRVLIIKPDGTFLVHQSKGMAAINYQGPGAVVKSEVAGGGLVVSAERKKPNNPLERIQVFFESVAFADSFEMRDDSSLRLFGSERQLSDLLMQDLHLIEEGLVPLKKESEVRRGTIDILAEDREKNLVVVEVKRRKAELAAATQLKRYVEELAERKGRRVRGILVAPGVTDGAHRMLEKTGLEFFKMDYEIGNPSARIKGLEKKQRELGEFVESGGPGGPSVPEEMNGKMKKHQEIKCSDMARRTIAAQVRVLKGLFMRASCARRCRGMQGKTVQGERKQGQETQ